MVGAARQHHRLDQVKSGRPALQTHWHSRASGARDRDRRPRSPRPLRRWHRRKSLRAPKKDRPLSFICLIASKPNAGRTEVCLTPMANYSTLIARHPYMRTLRERPCAAALTTPVRARAERAWGHGERVVAVPQHATRRCGGRAQAWCVCGRGEREPAAPCLPHVPRFVSVGCY